MKLFLKISNLCNHNTSTLRTDRQTDGQTDGQTTCHSNTALCVASRGKKGRREGGYLNLKFLENTAARKLVFWAEIAKSSTS